MEDDVMDYYSFLSKVITVNGTDEEEIFTVTQKDGRLEVQVTNGSGKRKIYERSFDQADTKQIELNGLKGADQFIIDENVSSKIGLILDGGEGDDRYDLKGNIRNKIFDRKSENNQFINTRRSNKELE